MGAEPVCIEELGEPFVAEYFCFEERRAVLGQTEDGFGGSGNLLEYCCVLLWD